MLQRLNDGLMSELRVNDFEQTSIDVDVRDFFPRTLPDQSAPSSPEWTLLDLSSLNSRALMSPSPFLHREKTAIDVQGRKEQAEEAEEVEDAGGGDSFSGCRRRRRRERERKKT